MSETTVRRIVGPTILLQSGSYFDLLAPEQSQFTIEDIAHGLSMVCRFAGQCQEFYSVAQHSVHVSEIVAPEHAFAALMHDAVEAFIGDVSKPLKTLLPEYSVIEGRIEAAVLARFGLSVPLPRAVKEADIAMLATEQRSLMRNNDDWEYTHGVRPLPMDIHPWPSKVARKLFMARFHVLGGPYRREL